MCVCGYDLQKDRPVVDLSCCGSFHIFEVLY